MRSGWLSYPRPTFSQLQKYWLFRQGVLTEGLRQFGYLQLRVVSEYSDRLSESEAWMLQHSVGQPIWVREILMSIDNIDCVFARSFTSLDASKGLWKGMRQLRTRPIGDILHHNSQVHRSRFFATRLSLQEPIYKSAKRCLQENCPAPSRMLARCSVFVRSEQPLLVAECFLPKFWMLAGEFS